MIERSVVESGCLLGAGARVERSLLMPGVRVGAGARICDTVVAPGVRLPAGLDLDGQLVTPADWGRIPGRRCEEREGLVYTALGPGPGWT